MKKIIITILTATLLLSCGVKERALRYDNNLLSDETQNVELHINYQVPAGFLEMSKEFVDNICKQELEADPFCEKRVAIYVDTLLSGANISLYDVRHLPYERTEDRLDLYFSAYNPNGTWEKIEKNIFKHGDFKKIVELDMVNETTDKRLLKYYFYENDRAQFCVDYFFKNSYYNDLKPYIDASLASFHKNMELIIKVEDLE